MDDRPPPIRRLFRELRRRRVFQVAVVYLVVGWAVIEVGDVVFPALAVPDWALRLLIAIVALGFPIAMVLAWAFDITPEGVRRTDSLPADGTGLSGVAPGRPEHATRAAYLGGGVLVALAAVAAVSLSRGGAAEDEPLRSVAVLPFENISADPEQEYFSDGLTEELLNALAKVPDLQVAARTSSFAFKGHHDDVRAIGRKLGVSVVVEGSVRKAGDRIRITAQLIKVSDGYHLWSETYDRDLVDVFAVQEEISRAIADALKLELEAGSTTRLARATGDVEAYDLYLRGRHVVRTRTSEAELREAVGLFDEAIRRDPGYARAYAGLAEAYLQLAHYAAPGDALAQAKAAALKAVALGDDLAETHTAVGHVRLHYDFDWSAAEAAYRKALELAPDDPNTWLDFSHYLSSARRFEEALAAARRALDLRRVLATDTLRSRVGEAVTWAHVLYEARRYDEAIEVSRRALALEPGAMGAKHALAEVSVAQGRPEIGIPIFEEMIHHGASNVLVDLCYALGRAGRTDESRTLLRQIEERARSEYVPQATLAKLHLALGERDRALDLLEAAVDAHEYELPHIYGSAAFESLHDDSRFRALMRRIGAPM